MGCHVHMPQTAAAVLDDDKHVEQPKRRRDGDKEVARENTLRVIPQEGRPTLITAGLTWRSPGQVLADRPWRDPHAQLEQQFVGNALFAPDRIVLVAGCTTTSALR